MKKLLFFIITLVGILSTICIFGCNGCNKNDDDTNDDNAINSESPEDPIEEPTEKSKYEIKFIVDNEIYSTVTVAKGETLTEPIMEDRDEYVFKGWYTAEDYIINWQFETNTVEDDISLYGYWVKVEEETFNVLFTDGENIIECVQVSKGSAVTEISASGKEGSTFTNWYYGEELFDFDTLIENDITLTAKWNLNVYTASFIADGNSVDNINFTVENMQISEPDVPPKQYYAAKWDDYTLTLDDIEITAVYTPIVYTATIIIGTTKKEIDYTVEDPVTLPDIPEKTGYSSAWYSAMPEGGDFTLEAIYTPITYYVSYFVDGKVISKQKYTVESKNIIPPAVPSRDGYSGSWEQKEYETGDITINANYTIIVYTATFLVDDVTIDTDNFQVDNMTVDEPDIPFRTGYTASWEEYVLGYEDIKIRAIYTPTVYTAYLIVDDVRYSSVQFTVEDKFLKLPSVPEKQGYSAVWSSYTIAANDLLIEANYTPLIYWATFMADEVCVAQVPFTVLDRDIKIPALPKKSGYTAKWSEFNLAFEDVTIGAVYTEIYVDGGWNKADEFEYTQQSDGSLTVTKYTGSAKNPVIPSEHEGLPVKSIGVRLFSGATISAIRIGEGIETIQIEAFLNCQNLQTVILPESLKKIEQNAFAYCSSIEEIDLPNGITEIQKQAFGRTMLRDIKIPDNLKVLDDVFWHCDYLESVTLGENLETIKSNAFNNCKFLKEVNLNKNLKTISSEAFNTCPELKSITIPNSVTLIEPKAFTGCTNLTEVYFEDTENWIICNENNVPVHDLDSEEILKEISNASTAAYWLKTVHQGRYWKKIIN